MSVRDASVVSAWSKARIAVAVGSGLLLFALAAGLTTWLAERPDLRTRLDLTHTGRNTLDPVLAELVSKLPELTLVEVFFKPLPPHFAAAGHDVQGRMNELLTVLQNSAPDKIKVIDHSPEDLAGSAETLARLHVDGDEYGLVVVHRDKNRVKLALFRELAEIDIGNPRPDHYEAARMVAFRGGQALASALKRVAASDKPKLYFTSGHGERALFGAAANSATESRDLGGLAAALGDDGFEVERFEGKGQALPADCAALAIVDPSLAFGENELGPIYAYLDAGGRVLLSGSHVFFDGPGSTRAIAAHYGIELGSGYVAEPIASANGPVVGAVQCANIYSRSDGLQARHPVTESLSRFDRAVVSTLARPVSRKSQIANVALTELVFSSKEAWIDLPDESGTYDWKPDRVREAAGKRFGLAYAAQIALAGETKPSAEQRQGRLIVLGSPEFLSTSQLSINKDFALNAFNWLAAREYRLSVAPREEERRALDVRQEGNLLTLRSLALFLLPGICLILGLVTWQLRRR